MFWKHLNKKKLYQNNTEQTKLYIVFLRNFTNDVWNSDMQYNNLLLC